MLKRACTFVYLTLLLAACGPTPPQAEGPRYSDTPARSVVPIYRLAIHPLHNPNKLTEAYQPLVDYLNLHMEDASLQLEASRDYAAYEIKIRAREAEFLLPNPWQTLEAMKVGYGVIAIAGDANDAKGLFLVRRDSGIRVLADVKGKVVSYPSPTAVISTLSPQYYLHTHGVDVNRDIVNNYVGSQESSIMHVFLKQSDVGATWMTPWRSFQKDHPQEAEQLRVAWETPPLINNSVMARNDVPPRIRYRVRKLLAGLHDTKEGRILLQGMQTRLFQPATDADYEPVREFIKRFEREVRPVEQK